MPRVPDYEPQVAARTPQRDLVRLDPGLDRQGAAVQQAGNAVGNALQQTSQLQVREMDAAKTMELRRKLDEWELNNIRDPEKGALYQRGQNAFGVSQRMEESLTKFGDDLRGTITSPRQQRLLEELVTQRKSSVVSQLGAHEARERSVYAETEVKATLDQTADNIAAYWNDPDRVAKELQWGEAAIIEQGRQKGLSATVTNGLLDEYRSKAQRQRVLVALDTDPYAAKDLVEELGDQLLPADRLAIQKTLEPAITQKNGERIGQRVFESWSGDSGNLSAAMDELNGIEDADERRYAKAWFNDLREAEATRQKEAYSTQLNTAWDSVLGGTHWSELPPSMMAGLKVEDRKALMKWKTGAGQTTNWNTFSQLSETYASNPKAFLEISQSTYMNDLAEPELRTVLGWRRDVLNGVDTAAQRAWIGTRNQVVNQALAGMGIETGSKASTNDIQRADEFRSVASRAYESWLAANPGKETMPETEFRQMINRLAVEVKLPDSGLIFDDTARVYQLPEGQPVRIDVEDVPATDRRMIEDALIRRQLPVTDEAVVNYYMKSAGLRGGE